MQMPADRVDDILACHGVRGPWEALKATGVANRIYATKDVVLGVAKDNAEAVADGEPSPWLRQWPSRPVS
jgi:hypothetical protein